MQSNIANVYHPWLDVPIIISTAKYWWFESLNALKSIFFRGLNLNPLEGILKSPENSYGGEVFGSVRALTNVTWGEWGAGIVKGAVFSLKFL